MAYNARRPPGTLQEEDEHPKTLKQFSSDEKQIIRDDEQCLSRSLSKEIKSSFHWDYYFHVFREKGEMLRSEVMTSCTEGGPFP